MGDHSILKGQPRTLEGPALHGGGASKRRWRVLRALREGQQYLLIGDICLDGATYKCYIVYMYKFAKYVVV